MSQPTKTIKVDEAVHDELRRLKRQSGAETFNAVLRAELGLTPDVDLDTLTAYYQEDLREIAREVVSIIENFEEVTKEITETNEREVLNFVSESNGRTIAAVEFSETGIDIKYRDQSGEMSSVGSCHRYNPDGDLVCSNGVSVDRLLSRIHSKVKGAHRRWA